MLVHQGDQWGTRKCGDLIYGPSLLLVQMDGRCHYTATVRLICLSPGDQETWKRNIYQGGKGGWDKETYLSGM